jgi:hypothetical protein
VFDVALERWWTKPRDPEFTGKLDRLRACLASEPGRPLVLFIGSSRTLFGLRPEILPPCRTVEGRQQLVFNFGLTAHGPPLYQLVALRRVLAEGIRPAWVFLEILPKSLMPDRVEENPFLIQRLAGSDLSVVRRYWSSPWPLYQRWCCRRLVPCFEYRFSLLSSLAPTWLPFSVRQDHLWNDVDDLGWVLTPAAVSAEKHQRMLQKAREEYAASLKVFSVAPAADRALRELLDLCRSRRIHVALYLMPEGEVFQSWYGPTTRPTLDRYLASLKKDYGVPLIDARNWVPEKGFFDSHHLMQSGAEIFTRRFGRDVLSRIVGGGKSEELALGRK